jgi:hypothetical protein
VSGLSRLAILATDDALWHDLVRYPSRRRLQPRHDLSSPSSPSRCRQFGPFLARKSHSVRSISPRPERGPGLTQSHTTGRGRAASATRHGEWQTGADEREPAEHERRRNRHGAAFVVSFRCARLFIEPP